MRLLSAFLIPVLAPIAVWAAEPPFTAGEAAVQVSVDPGFKPVEEQGFLSVRAIRGKGWSIEKYQGTDGLWYAKLTAKNAVVEEFGNCGDQEDWMRFLLWPINAETPRLLMVLRYAGGANGPDYLDVVRLDESYRSVFRSGEGVNFVRLEDLDNTGFPEIVLASRHYRFDLLGLGGANAPRPFFVAAYSDKARRYVTANQDHLNLLRPEAERLRTAFESHPKANPPFSYVQGQMDLEEPLGYLVGYILQLCYMGDPDKAWAYLDAYAAPQTAATVRAAVSAKLDSDTWYQDILKRQWQSVQK